MRKYFSIFAVFAVMGASAAQSPNNWFDVGDISSYSWPTDGSDYKVSNGTWSATAAAKKNGASLELVDENTDLRFTPTMSVESTDHAAKVVAHITFSAFSADDLSFTPTYDSLGSLIVVDEGEGVLAYYGAGYSATTGENEWICLGGEPKVGEAVEVSISVGAERISYAVEGKLLGTTDAYPEAQDPKSITLAGAGAISSLAGYKEVPSTPSEDIPDTYRLIEMVSAYSNQYFVTPLHAHEGIAARVKLRWKDVTRDQVLIGAKSSAGIFSLLGVKNGRWTMGYKEEGSVTDTGVSVEVDRWYEVTVILENGRQSLQVDGTEIFHSNESTVPNLNLNLYVFALNANGTASNRAAASVRSIKLYEKKKK